ncbi:MAG TPA: diguanylate cyclase [Solirubrobacteraceae bacterium]|jgi:diguanylate cyclase (GGDEF)-like protein|nr:diguanylate cyclase [Solirubrobacteraceae bacterium]
MTPATSDGVGPAPNRGPWPAILAAVGALLLVLGALATAILLSQGSARSQLRSSLAARGKASAGFVATYLSEQGTRERLAAERFLSAPRVDTHNLEVIAATLGSEASVLLDNAGHVLAAHPSDPSRRSTAVISAYSNLSSAEHGHVAISGLFYDPDDGAASTSVTVAFSTSIGRRLLSAAYPTSILALNALVDQTISYPQHAVYLVDSGGRIVTSSPRTAAVTLARANPDLATAVTHGTHGSVGGARGSSAFTAAAVPGTPWRLVIAVPNRKLYASTRGWAQFVPWLVFALVSLLGTLLVLLFARSLADRARLTVLSAQMERIAQTDSLTGLNNRRALTEQLTRATAHARRHEQALSVLMIDLDRFKQTNDSHGHEAGDQVLCTVADCMRDTLRAADIYGRWGGDEFLVALSDTDAAGAAVTAARLREAAAAMDLGDIGLPDGVPLCVGVATGVHTNPHDLVREADEALYRAKHARSQTDALAPH